MTAILKVCFWNERTTVISVFLVILTITFFCSCSERAKEVSENKNALNERLAKRKINIDSLVSSNKDNIFFMNFYYGMDKYVYDSMKEIEHRNGNLFYSLKNITLRVHDSQSWNEKAESCYKFSFEKKDGKLIDVPVYLSPEFKESKLVSLTLHEVYIESIWSAMDFKNKLENKDNEFTSELYQNELREKKNTFNQLINIYKVKYGDFKITTDKFNNTLRVFEDNHKMIFISGDLLSASTEIKYIDKNYYESEVMKADIKKDSTLKKSIEVI